MDRLVGVFLIVVSAASFGANPIFARIAYDAGANPSTFLFFRFAIASAVMFLIMIIGNFKFPRGRLLFTLVMMGGVGIVGTTISFYTALTLAPVSLVVVLASMYPAFVTFLAAIFFKQRITNYKIAALFLTMMGIVFTVGLDIGGQFLGIVLSVTTAVIYSVFLMFGSLSVQKAGAFSASTVITVAAFVIYGLLVTVQGMELPTVLSGWISIAASAIISTTFGSVAFFAGLKRIDTANTSIISTLEVVVSIALAIIVLGETITLSKIIGATMVISAVAILAKSEYKVAELKIR